MTRLLLRFITVFGLVVFTNSCGKAGAGTLEVVAVAAPDPYVKCFALLEDGKATGLGCVPR